MRDAGNPVKLLHSIVDSTVYQLLEQSPVVGTDRAGRLSHVDRNDLLLRVYPEISSCITRPHELARRARNARNTWPLAHREAKAEGVARHAEQEFSRRHRRGDA